MEELLAIAYEHKAEFTQREFDCLIALIEDGDITTKEELAQYV